MSYERFDEALDTLRNTAPETRKGGPNHGPMAAEAMVALGRADAVVRWAEQYRSRLVELHRSDAELDVDWMAALGDFNRLPRWQTYFERTLADQPWPVVVKLWLPRLLPGAMATGTHGVIRCGHAARALEHGVTPLRLEELASGLAYCAARYARLGPAPTLSGELELEAAVAELPLLASTIERRGPPPLVVRRLQALGAFRTALDRLAPPVDLPRALSQMTAIGAGLYLANAARHPLVLLHAVTGPAAFRLLLPYLPAESRGEAFAYVWQAFAAWASAFGAAGATFDGSTRSAEWDEIIERAVGSGEEHAIKLTDAARREDMLHPSPLFRLAAADWVERVERSRTWSSEERMRAGIAARL